MANYPRLSFAVGLCCLWVSPASAEGTDATDSEETASTAITATASDPGSTAADADSVQPTEPAGQPAQHSRWELTSRPYVWFSGIKGDMGVVSEVQPVAVDFSFIDIVSHLKFAIMADGEARHGRFVASGDLMFVKLSASDDIKIREVDFVDAKLKSTTFITTLTAGYRVLDKDRLYFDLFAGGRLNAMKTGLDLDGPQRSFSGSKTQTWLDPLIGARFHMPLGPKWTARTYADLGGFGIGSHMTWQLLGTIDYDLSTRWSLTAGWRHLSIDYSHHGFVFDAAMDGPILGAIHRF